MRQVLVVANRTLGGEDLVAAAKEKLDQGPCEFWLVVPATPPPGDEPDLLVGPGGGLAWASTGEADPAREDPYEVAERKLAQGVESLRVLDVPVGGEVGDPDPATAVDDAMRSRSFDEVIVSMLPGGVSHWFRLDLPGRVQRKHHVPVTTVTVRVQGAR